jgi:hypothetical protein
MEASEKVELKKGSSSTSTGIYDKADQEKSDKFQRQLNDTQSKLSSIQKKGPKAGSIS